MQELTSIERIDNILHRKPVDRIGVFEHFWGDTFKEWQATNQIQPNIDTGNLFGFDIAMGGGFNMAINMNYYEKIDETEDTVTAKNGNYAIMKNHKKHDSTPEHIGFTITDKASWEEYAKPFLKADRSRINFEGYKYMKNYAQKNNVFFMATGAHIFEIMKDVTGHENMLVGMILEPDWILDMAKTYSQMLTDMQEMLFDECGWPDGMFYYEDMGFKERPFCSPEYYKTFLQPGHKQTIDHIKSHNKPFTMHSCGFVEPLLPGMLEAGIDCLQVIEVKAGMDPVRIFKNYGDRLSLMGGIDVRTLYSNDKKIIDAELESKIPIIMKNNGYILHSDHSIPPTVTCENFQYYLKKGVELGTYR